MENKFYLTKQECEKIIGHIIRKDTYLMIQKLFNGEKYEDIYNFINNNRDELSIKKDIILTSEKKCQEYLQLLNEENKIKRDKIINNKIKEDKIITNRKTKKDKIIDSKGIYGIYIDDKLIYIGETNKSFKERFQQHKYNMNDPSNLTYLYRILRSAKQLNKNIQLKPIIVVEDLIINDNMKITERDIKMMELALITLYQPEANIEGRLTPYQ